MEGDWDKMTKEEKPKWMIKKGIEILGEVFRSPYQVIHKLVNYEYEFVIGKFPKEVFSDETPPRELGERTEIIPIDECLGLYEPKKTKITIFNRGIEDASKLIKCNPEHLKYIVRLHEWSHALVHIGFCESKRLAVLKDENLWDKELAEATKIYTSIEDKLHEHIAQLLTYHSLTLISQDAEHEESRKILNNIIKIFLELNKRQPPYYRIDEYLDVPRNRIIQSITLLKKGWLKGVFDGWKTVIKW